MPELAKLASVDLWHHETAEERPADVPRIRFRRAADVESSALAHYDLIVYNLGNHLPFHNEIFHLAQRVPGVIVLHDFVMHHFFAGQYLDDLKRPDFYVEAMRRLYGERGRAVAAAAISGKKPPIWETDEVIDFPMFEDVVRGSYGVITHSNFLAEEVRRVFDGPVCKIPLACELPRAARNGSKQELGIPADRLLIVTVGHVNPNKRVHSVLAALATLGEMRKKIIYAVLGPYPNEYHKRLQELVRTGRLNESVRFLGYVPDDVLHAYIQQADLCVNLRFPAFEGASGSIVEELWYGKPVIVTDTGFYSELPDDAVWKITPDREAQDLPIALRELLENPDARGRLSRNALEFAQSQFQVSHYVQELLKFSWEVRRNKPVLEFADRLGKELGELGVTTNMDAATSIADRAYRLLFGS
ncbi:MAG: glycosyltransferase family 4 protein [Bryobacteraceae bacterium]